MKDDMSDWTIDPKTGASNSSLAFTALCAEVEQLIRGDAHMLIAGNAGMTARLIMAKLAHEYGLEPHGSRALTGRLRDDANPTGARPK
jgi:hypothetical protein